jgi:hypothetical protein
MTLYWIERKILGLLVKAKGVLYTPLFAENGLVFMPHSVLPEKERNKFTHNKDFAITSGKLEVFILFFKQNCTYLFH